MPRSSTALRTRTTALLAALTAAALSPATRAQSTEILAIIGDAAPDANGSFLGLGSPALNDAGQAAFFGSFTGTAGGSSDDTGLFRSDGTSGALTQLAREGQAAPDNNGSLSSYSAPALNDAGQAAFFGILTGTAGGSSDDLGIFRSDGSSGGLTQLAREGQAAPDNNGSFSGFGNPALNDAGQAAFVSTLTGTAGGSSDNGGIFRSDGSSGGLTQLAREGQAAPDNNGSFSGFNSSVALNDAGQAAFTGFLTGTAGGGSDNSGLFRGDGTSGGLTQLAREGQAAPDNNGSFSSFGNPALNDAGQAAFVSTLTGTAGGSSDDFGIFRSDGSSGGLTQLAREGQAAPDNNGSFSGFGNPALNDAGQAAFVST
ncbi:MAG: choice-of-anchor tandem repeat NxxGxxAF-containing protein, partial [Planctomycetota bacterium]